MKKQSNNIHENLNRGITEMQLAVNNCSSSINKFIEAFENKVPVNEGIDEYKHRNLTSHSLIQALESLQEIRKIVLKKQKLCILNKDNFKSSHNAEPHKWAELEKEIFNELKNYSKNQD